MLFRIKENEILILIEQFMKSQQLLGSLRSLEKESKVVLGNLDEVCLFLTKSMHTTPTILQILLRYLLLGINFEMFYTSRGNKLLFLQTIQY